MEPHSEDSDSAPEDVAFQDAKEDALAHIKTVSQAATQKKKLRKEVNKKRREKLTEQKQVKRQKLAELESKKLPSSVLEDLDGTEEEESNNRIEIAKPSNTRLTFDENNSLEDAKDYIALETSKTDFKILTDKDLRSNNFKFQEASSFRDKMLNGGRVRREPHSNKIRREEKKKVCGLNSKLSAWYLVLSLNNFFYDFQIWKPVWNIECPPCPPSKTRQRE